MHPSQIVMYTTEFCPDCHRAKTYFEANKINFIKVELEDDEEATKFVINVNQGCQSVPTIIFPDGSVLVEPSWSDLKKITQQSNFGHV